MFHMGCNKKTIYNVLGGFTVIIIHNLRQKVFTKIFFCERFFCVKCETDTTNTKKWEVFCLNRSDVVGDLRRIWADGLDIMYGSGLRRLCKSDSGGKKSYRRRRFYKETSLN